MPISWSSYRIFCPVYSQYLVLLESPAAVLENQVTFKRQLNWISGSWLACLVACSSQSGWRCTLRYTWDLFSATLGALAAGLYPVTPLVEWTYNHSGTESTALTSAQVPVLGNLLKLRALKSWCSHWKQIRPTSRFRLSICIQCCPAQDGNHWLKRTWLGFLHCVLLCP